MSTDVTIHKYEALVLEFGKKSLELIEEKKNSDKWYKWYTEECKISNKFRIELNEVKLEIEGLKTKATIKDLNLKKTKK